MRSISRCLFILMSGVSLSLGAQPDWPAEKIPLRDKILGDWINVDGERLTYWHFSKTYGEVSYWRAQKSPSGAPLITPADRPSRSFSYKIKQLDEKSENITIIVDGGAVEKYSIGIIQRAMVRNANGTETNLFYVPKDEAQETFSGRPIVMAGRFPSEVRKKSWPSGMSLREKIQGHWLGVFENVGADGNWFISNDKIYMVGRTTPCSYQVLRADERSQQVIVRLTCHDGDHTVRPLWYFSVATDSRAISQRQKIESPMMGHMEIGADLFFIDSREQP